MEGTPLLTTLRIEAELKKLQFGLSSKPVPLTFSSELSD